MTSIRLLQFEGTCQVIIIFEINYFSLMKCILKS
jgi:hypothetical protein